MSDQVLPDGPPSVPSGAKRSTRADLVRLISVVVLGVVAAVLTNSLPVLIVILALIVIVMGHELGHFATAKWSGMKVTEYFLGFGPRLWSIRRGETDYGVKAIPAGGYVRIVGMTTAEEVDPTDEPRSYRQASFPRRLLVGVAGSAMHFVMAFLLIFAIFAISGLPTAAIAEVAAAKNFPAATSPAVAAGLRAGDVFVAVDGHRYSLAQQFIDFIQSHPDKPITLVVRRGNRLVSLHITPVDGRHVRVGPGQKAATYDPASGPAVGLIGVELNFLDRDETVNPAVAVPRSAVMLASLTKATALGIGEVFSFHGLSSFVHQVAKANSAKSGSSSVSNDQFVSIVGAVQIGAQAARQDTSELLFILIAINLFVGMVNLFPMLPLDGGHVVIAVYERLRTRRGRRYHADVTKLMPLTYAFLICLVALGLGALYLNVLHPATLPGG